MSEPESSLQPGGPDPAELAGRERLTEPRGGDASDRIINALTRITPAA